MYLSTDGSFIQSRQKIFKKHRNQNLDDEINNLFNKKFRFRFCNEWKLPTQGTWFIDPPWVVNQIEKLKYKLNFHKSQLNDFNIEEWSSHTRRRNPAGEVCWRVRCVINPEFLTQAWTKFYECAYSYNIVPPQATQDKKIVSLHLCEAPGAFITSLNHYLKCHHPTIEWNWVASTLNPYYEGNSPSNMISDDRFMFHTLHNWDFGLDFTGNLMEWDNSQALIKRAKSLGKVLLVTADGSIDCLQKPDAQEEVTSPLHYCEIVTALQALSEGGTFIFKLFTIFEHSTINLMYLINNLFSEVNIYKPVTSRQGNSEVYAVCLDFKGGELLEPYIPTLRLAYGTDLYSNTCLFPLSALPHEFLQQIEECSDYFCALQCDIINSNLQTYLMQKTIPIHTDMKRIRTVVATTFLRLYDLKSLDYQHEILKGRLHHDDQKMNTNPRYHRGSFSERQLYTVMSLKEKSKHLSTFLNTDVLSNPLTHTTEPLWWINMFENDLELQLVFSIGKPLEKINSSKFIFTPIFKLFQQILSEKEFEDIVHREQKHIKHNEITNLDESADKLETLVLPEFTYLINYSSYEKTSLKILLNVLKDLNMGDSVILHNYVTLTHFNVSVLFILCKKSFEKVGFTSDGGIILFNLKNKDGFKLLQTVLDECEKALSDCKDVLSALPVQLTNTEQFFNSLVLYNNTLYRNKCILYLSIIDKSLQN